MSNHENESNAEAMVDTDLTYGQVTQDVLEPLFTMGKAYMAALGLVGCLLYTSDAADE